MPTFNVPGLRLVSVDGSYVFETMEFVVSQRDHGPQSYQTTDWYSIHLGYGFYDLETGWRNDLQIEIDGNRLSFGECQCLPTNWEEFVFRVSTVNWGDGQSTQLLTMGQYRQGDPLEYIMYLGGDPLPDDANIYLNSITGTSPITSGNFSSGNFLFMDIESVQQNYPEYPHGDDVVYGSAGIDLLYGDDNNNTLLGASNNDELYGGNGNDRLFGESDNDKLYGGNGNDNLYGGSGTDRLFGGDSGDELFGQKDNDFLYGENGADKILGGGGDDSLFGGNGHDLLYGSYGNDRLLGGNDDDRLYGGRGQDRMYGNDGRDRLYGGSSADVMIGGNDRDYLNGGIGNDRLYGGNGFDQLYGNAGNDLMVGGSGSDDFIFKSGQGDNIIRDFDALDNGEDIILRGVTAITSYSDLAANHMEQSGANVVIDDGQGLTITLVNVDLGDLGARDFLF